MQGRFWALQVSAMCSVQVASWGYNSVLVSAHSNMGLTELHACMKAHTSVIAGPSGVGKSSLINSLHLRSQQQQQQQQHASTSTASAGNGSSPQAQVPPQQQQQVPQHDTADAALQMGNDTFRPEQEQQMFGSQSACSQAAASPSAVPAEGESALHQPASALEQIDDAQALIGSLPHADTRHAAQPALEDSGAGPRLDPALATAPEPSDSEQGTDLEVDSVPEPASHMLQLQAVGEVGIASLVLMRLILSGCHLVCN